MKPAVCTISILLATLFANSHVGAAEVGPVLARYCLDCHDASTKKGGLSLEGVKRYQDATPAVWAAIREKIQLREMPPKKKLQPGDEEKQNLVTWIEQSLLAAGEHIETKLDLPNYGNYVDHEALFHAKAYPFPATSVRVWRHRPEVYEAMAAGVGIQPFAMAPGHQFSDFSKLYVVDESSAEIVLRNAQQMVEARTRAVLKDGKMIAEPGSKTPAVLLPLLNPDKEPSGEEIKAALNWQFVQCLMRAPTDDELSRLTALLRATSEKYGRVHGARAALTAPMLMPEAVYRLELGAGPLDEHGRRRLTAREIRTAIHFTLFNGSPGATLSVKADLENRAGVEAFVTQLLAGAPKPRVLKFFDEYFDYEKATGVFKEPPDALAYNAGSMVRDTKMLIQHIVADDKDVLATLLTTTQTYATDGHSYARGVPRIYGLPYDWKPRDGQLVELPPDQRAGILTQPAWLIAHSGNFDNDPVRRGKWIRERLLGGTIPDVPVTVDAVVPENKAKTLRERFEVIAKSDYCWRCHQYMNPLGMPFEAYDHFGRFRTKELKRPVDSSGAITASGEAALDGNVSDAVEMIRRLARHEHTQEVFVRYAFRFFLGRNETVRDARTLQEANAAYKASGGSMKALIISLLSSDSFLYRSPEL